MGAATRILRQRDTATGATRPTGRVTKAGILRKVMDEGDAKSSVRQQRPPPLRVRPPGRLPLALRQPRGDAGRASPPSVAPPAGGASITRHNADRSIGIATSIDVACGGGARQGAQAPRPRHRVERRQTLASRYGPSRQGGHVWLHETGAGAQAVAPGSDATSGGGTTMAHTGATERDRRAKHARAGADIGGRFRTRMTGRTRAGPGAGPYAPGRSAPPRAHSARKEAPGVGRRRTRPLRRLALPALLLVALGGLLSVPAHAGHLVKPTDVEARPTSWLIGLFWTQTDPTAASQSTPSEIQHGSAPSTRVSRSSSRYEPSPAPARSGSRPDGSRTGAGSKPSTAWRSRPRHGSCARGFATTGRCSGELSRSNSPVPSTPGTSVASPMQALA